MTVIRDWDPDALEMPPTRVGWVSIVELLAADTCELMVELDVGVAACEPARAIPFALTPDQAEELGWLLIERAALARIPRPTLGI